MVETQLQLTNELEKESLATRKELVQSLQRRARKLHKRWADIFGPHDTPVPIDRGWRNLTIAFSDIQSKEVYEDRISMAKEQLDQAEWILEHEQGVGSNGRGSA